MLRPEHARYGYITVATTYRVCKPLPAMTLAWTISVRSIVWKVQRISEAELHFGDPSGSSRKREESSRPSTARKVYIGIYIS